jgi:hypothetical protein
MRPFGADAVSFTMESSKFGLTSLGNGTVRKAFDSSADARGRAHVSTLAVEIESLLSPD